MEEHKALIVSLNYSPGHFSHLRALDLLCRDLGLQPTLLLHQGYSAFMNERNDSNTCFYNGSIPEGKFDFVFIQNPSTENHTFAQRIKLQGEKPLIFYIYHEPFDGFRNKLKEGMKGFPKAIIAHQFNKKTLSRVDCVLLPSIFAVKTFEASDVRHNPKYQYLPLLFEDETQNYPEPGNSRKRIFFSYIGTVAKAHDFDGYMKYMEFAYKNKIGTKFLIATRSKIENLLASKPLLTEMISTGQLEVIQGRPLSNEKINECFAKSFCVWNLYRRSTQSGVLPKAFMFGTPVIASPVGSFPEFVNNGLNSELISKADDFEGITDALGKIEKSFGTYSSEAHKTFLETFYYKANTQRLKEIIDDVRGE
jgi:glycosyltransferase involved in cell wall biosynthesis